VQNERFTCKAFIVDYDLFKGWWCKSCPDCNKPLFGLPNNLLCMEHDYPTSAPVPWFNYHTYQDNLAFSKVLSDFPPAFISLLTKTLFHVF